MKASLIHRSKVISAEGAVEEIVLWQLPQPSKEFPEGIKYRLYYGLADGTCLLRYDNERHKGHHKHIKEHEAPYTFITVARLLEDFENDIDKIKAGEL